MNEKAITVILMQIKIIIEKYHQMDTSHVKATFHQQLKLYINDQHTDISKQRTIHNSIQMLCYISRRFISQFKLHPIVAITYRQMSMKREFYYILVQWLGRSVRYVQENTCANHGKYILHD